MNEYILLPSHYLLSNILLINSTPITINIITKQSKAKQTKGHHTSAATTTTSINQSWGAYAGGRVASPTLRRHSWRSRLASLRTPFPYRVTPSRRYRLATGKSSVGVPLASSKSGCPLRKKPDKQDRLPCIAPLAHKAAVDGLC